MIGSSSCPASIPTPGMARSSSSSALRCSPPPRGASGWPEQSGEGFRRRHVCIADSLALSTIRHGNVTNRFPGVALRSTLAHFVLISFFRTMRGLLSSRDAETGQSMRTISAPISDERHRPRTVASRPRHVMIVEDDSPIRAMLAELLEDAGYAVVQAADGLAGLRPPRDAEADLTIRERQTARLRGQ